MPLEVEWVRSKRKAPWFNQAVKTARFCKPQPRLIRHHFTSTVQNSPDSDVVISQTTTKASPFSTCLASRLSEGKDEGAMVV